MILLDTQKEEFNRLRDVRIFGRDDTTDLVSGNLLFIGLGGIGERVMTSLKGMLKDTISPGDNIHYMLIDSDIPAMEETIKNSKEGVGMNALEVMSVYRPNLENLLERGYNGQPVQENIAKWMRPDFPKLNIGTDGARGNRQIGRLMFSNAYEDIRILLFEKLEDVYGDSTNGKLDIIIVSGTCGGTSSGLMADLVYNIRAYVRSRKWSGVRVGGCLLMPDVLFANKDIYEDVELRTLLLANGFATMSEISEYMQYAYDGKSYVFESGAHRLSISENIFDSCMLISGKKDEQGYIPEGTIYSDVAYFLTKLAMNKYIDDENADGYRKLFKDSFFEQDQLGYFKVISEADYKVPVKEIENICEYSVFKEAYKRLNTLPDKDAEIEEDVQRTFGEMKTFLSGSAGDEIELGINGLIKTAQYEKPAYKDIKKRQDRLTVSLPQQLEVIKKDMPVMVKSLRIRMTQALDADIEKYMKEYGPFITMKMIGAEGYGGVEKDSGMVAEVEKLEELMGQYVPNQDYERIVESISQIVKRRFFAFPSAKRETEAGYYDACIKNALAKERSMLIEEMNSQDIFGDIKRLLRQHAEHLSDDFSQFGEDLVNAVEDLSREGERIVNFTLKDAKRHVFLPTDYVTEERIEQFREGLIAMMVKHEADMNSDKVVPVAQEMEHIYKNFLIGLGVYPNEKVIATAFADEQPSMQDINAMFVSFDSELRRDVMKRAAKAFVEGCMEKTERKKLCILKDGLSEHIRKRKYISLPDSMPHFSEAMKDVLVAEPYNEASESITTNVGEQVITMDTFYSGVKVNMLELSGLMEAAYGQVKARGTYMGLHTSD